MLIKIFKLIRQGFLFLRNEKIKIMLKNFEVKLITIRKATVHGHKKAQISAIFLIYKFEAGNDK